MAKLNGAPPQVSVLFPVYNAGEFLRSSLESILCQTYSDFELIVLYDHSSDNSLKILKTYSDRRIRIVENHEKKGLAFVLNKGIELSRGKYIARMDSDDICRPERFAQQVLYLESHPEVAIVGTWFRTISPEGSLFGSVARLETSPDAVKAASFFRSRMGHPTVMMRREDLEKHSLRYTLGVFAEDYDFWVKAISKCRIANIPKALLFYRKHPGQLTNQNEKSWSSTLAIRLTMLNELGIHPSPKEVELHQQICNSTFEPTNEFCRLAGEWLTNLKKSNDIIKLYPEPFFSQAILERWFAITFYTIKKMGINSGYKAQRFAPKVCEFHIKFLISQIYLRLICPLGDRLYNFTHSLPIVGKAN